MKIIGHIDLGSINERTRPVKEKKTRRQFIKFKKQKRMQFMKEWVAKLERQTDEMQN